MGQSPSAPVNPSPYRILDPTIGLVEVRDADGFWRITVCPILGDPAE